MSNPLRHIALILCFFMTISGCVEDNTEAQEKWVEDEVNKKIKNYRKEKMKECMNGIYAEAEMKIDSLLSDKDLFGSVVKDEIPDKPTKPEYIPLDTSVLENHKVEHVLSN